MDSILLGLGLGLASGLSPGPLLTLVLASTLQRGFGAGARVALAPLLTDGPIVVLVLLALRDLAPLFLSLLGSLGGAIVLYLGIDTLRKSAPPARTDPAPAGSRLDLAKGAIVNLLNPHPWIFWTTVQGPIVVHTWRREPAAAISFVATFYLAMIGSKIATAWIVARRRHSVAPRWYRRIVVGCGLLLVSMGAWLLLEGLTRAARI